MINNQTKSFSDLKVKDLIRITGVDLYFDFYYPPPSSPTIGVINNDNESFVEYSPPPTKHFVEKMAVDISQANNVQNAITNEIKHENKIHSEIPIDQINTYSDQYKNVPPPSGMTHDKSKNDLEKKQYLEKDPPLERKDESIKPNVDMINHAFVTKEIKKIKESKHNSDKPIIFDYEKLPPVFNPKQLEKVKREESNQIKNLPQENNEKHNKDKLDIDRWNAPYLIYPFHSNFNFDESNILFEDRENIYPIFNYNVDREALEVMIIYKKLIISVDYLTNKSGKYYLAGMAKSHSDLEYHYYLPREKIDFIEEKIGPYEGIVKGINLSAFEIQTDGRTSREVALDIKMIFQENEG
jgi:hypothetical protein